MAIIYHMGNKPTNNKDKGYILIGLGKAFGEINRNKLRWAIYEKALPTELLNTIKMGIK